MITHLKFSAIADGPDPSLVLPSDWNAVHGITPDTIDNILSDHDQVAHDWTSSGTATMFAFTKERTVDHGLAGTPHVTVTFDAFVIFRVVNKTATQFTVQVDAPQESECHFDWKADL